MFHSFNICIFSKIVGAEFFKSLKNLFFRIKKVLKKYTEANTRKMDTKFAYKTPHFNFHAGQFTRDIVFQKSRHAKAIHAL